MAIRCDVQMQLIEAEVNVASGIITVDTARGASYLRQKMRDGAMLNLTVAGGRYKIAILEEFDGDVATERAFAVRGLAYDQGGG